jgi:hypothetical protein
MPCNAAKIQVLFKNYLHWFLIVMALLGIVFFQDRIATTWNLIKPIVSNFDAICGLIIVAFVLVGLILISIIIINYFSELLPFSIKLRVSIENILNLFRSHVRKSIKHTYRGSKTRLNQKRLADVISITLDGIFDPKLIEYDFHENGNTYLPLLFCSFRSYAHAVTKLLDHISKLLVKDSLHTTRATVPSIVWTIFTKPLFHWYNTFSTEWIEGETVKKAYVTYRWWEEYKEGLALLKDNIHIQTCRIISDQSYINQCAGYFLYCNNTLNKPETFLVREARAIANRLGDSIEWHPDIRDLLFSKSGKWKDEIIYLIGKPNTSNATIQKFTGLIEHFRTTYHSDDLELPEINQAGAFLRYCKEKKSLNKLEKYEDVFIIDVSDSAKLGMVFINNGIAVSGARMLSEEEVKKLVKSIEKVWQNTSTELFLNRLDG